jgi:hypothetical protein
LAGSGPPSFVLEVVQGHLLSFKDKPPLIPANSSLETSLQDSGLRIFLFRHRSQVQVMQ